MTSEPINVLYVDDEQENLNSFTAHFRNDYNIFTALTGSEGLTILKDNTIHIIISDQRMSKMTGIEFLREARHFDPRPIRIMISANIDGEVLKEAINTISIFKFLSKPFEIELVQEAIHQAYEVYKYREEGKEILEKLMKTNQQLGAYLKEKQLAAQLIVASLDNLN